MISLLSIPQVAYGPTECALWHNRMIAHFSSTWRFRKMNACSIVELPPHSWSCRSASLSHGGRSRRISSNILGSVRCILPVFYSGDRPIFSFIKCAFPAGDYFLTGNFPLKMDSRAIVASEFISVPSHPYLKPLHEDERLTKIAVVPDIGPRFPSQSLFV